MKIVLFLVLLSNQLLAQVIYKPSIQLIEANNPIRVNWIVDAEKQLEFPFNKEIVFINADNDKRSNAIVIVKIFREQENKTILIQKFICQTGDNFKNHLISNKEILIKKNESIYLELSLITRNSDEKYVFNFYDTPSTVNGITVIYPIINSKLSNKRRKLLHDFLAVSFEFLQ